METYAPQKNFIEMFKAVLFTSQKQPKYPRATQMLSFGVLRGYLPVAKLGLPYPPVMSKWRNRLGYIHTMEHYAPVRMIHTTTWITLKSIVPQQWHNERRRKSPGIKRLCPVWLCLYEILGKTKKSDWNQMSGCLRPGKKEDEGLTSKGQKGTLQHQPLREA